VTTGQCKSGGSCSLGDGERRRLVRRALWLEYLTVGWNIIEGVVAVSAALMAGSVALLGFGIDSFVECTSGCIMIWRLGAEERDSDPERLEALDRRAHKLVAISLFVLAAYVTFEAVKTLWLREKPEPSVVGIALTMVSLVAMIWLARAKRRAAQGMGSRALEADAFQTTACWWLSLTTLVGIALNALFGFWWADPVAALGVAFFVVREGREAWEGEKECC